MHPSYRDGDIIPPDYQPPATPFDLQRQNLGTNTEGESNWQGWESLLVRALFALSSATVSRLLTPRRFLCVSSGDGLLLVSLTALSACLESFTDICSRLSPSATSCLTMAKIPSGDPVLSSALPASALQRCRPADARLHRHCPTFHCMPMSPLVALHPITRSRMRKGHHRE